MINLYNIERKAKATKAFIELTGIVPKSARCGTGSCKNYIDFTVELTNEITRFCDNFYTPTKVVEKIEAGIAPTESDFSTMVDKYNRTLNVGIGHEGAKVTWMAVNKDKGIARFSFRYVDLLNPSFAKAIAE